MKALGQWVKMDDDGPDQVSLMNPLEIYKFKIRKTVWTGWLPICNSTSSGWLWHGLEPTCYSQATTRVHTSQKLSAGLRCMCMKIKWHVPTSVLRTSFSHKKKTLQFTYSNFKWEKWIQYGIGTVFLVFTYVTHFPTHRWLMMMILRKSFQNWGVLETVPHPWIRGKSLRLHMIPNYLISVYSSTFNLGQILDQVIISIGPTQQ